eukprot:gnl/TRDRNA2_/TRDRNA2_112081_c0_seq1.p1 gnl/TRDRNA2_/TRDRNA2_112081_c0~~gnl/TRDRNA2_/TRDRNA2_112081_c0_seq1.p1  ORF type:complete len:278 (+),score=18.24 gnl/TRDRNA2_/TRDRNA2_112081_c0_seq1:47-835(+)
MRDIVLRMRPCRYGGSGSQPWRASVALAAWICRHPDYFTGHDVLELGSGAAGLPSQCVALCDAYPYRIRVSDFVSEVIESLHVNLALNELENRIEVCCISWQDAASGACKIEKPSLILFADCIYSNETAALLCCAICNLLCPGGTVIGVLPAARGGVDVFEGAMAANGFLSEQLSLCDNPEPAVIGDLDALCFTDSTESEHRLLKWCHSVHGMHLSSLPTMLGAGILVHCFMLVTLTSTILTCVGCSFRKDARTLQQALMHT